MKISVITVAYNSASTIRETLDSVAAQSHHDIEHIVIDGGSTDDTVGIVNRFGARVSKLVSKSDNGIYDAMNKGLALAGGNAIGFLNADDVYATSNVLGLIAESFHRDQVDIVFGDLVYVKQGDSNAVVRKWRTRDFSQRQLRLGWMPPHPSVFVTRNLIDRVGDFDLQFRIAADYDFLLRCFSDRALRWKYVEQTLVRMRTGGVSNRSLRTLVRKSREDWCVLRKNNVGGLLTLACKNFRKLPQFIGN